MTSTLTPPDASGTERGPRLPVMVADLLPDDIVQARRARQVRRAVLAVLAAFTVGLIAWGGLVIYQTSHARGDLAEVQEDADLVRAKQNDYSEVVTVRGQSAQITAKLTALLARDLQYGGLLSAVRQLAPHGIQLTNINGTLPDGAKAATTGTAVELPNTTGERRVGTLTVGGIGASKALIASYVDSLARLAGLGNPVVTAVNLTEGSLRFVVQLDITESMLGGRYTTTGGDH